MSSGASDGERDGRRSSSVNRGCVSQPSRVAHGLGLLLLLTQCTSQPTTDIDQVALQRAILRDATERVILPQLADMQTASSDLNSRFVGRSRARGQNRHACEALADPSDTTTLGELRAAWNVTKDRGKQAESVGFGPIKTLRLGTEFDFWPTRPTSINKAMAASTSWTSDDMAALGNAAKGLPALEWLLYTAPNNTGTSVRASDALVRQSLLADGARRCHFAAAIAAHTHTTIGQLARAWARDAGNFAAAFEFAGREQDATGAPGWVSAYPSSLAALSDLINAMVGQLHALEVNKVGTPLGGKSGGTAVPEEVEAPYSQRSLADLKANLDGFATLYGQGTNLGLRGALQQHSTALSVDIDDALTLAKQQLDAIPTPLATAVLQHHKKVEALHKTFGKLRVLFASDVANVFGITVTFTDADGD